MACKLVDAQYVTTQINSLELSKKMPDETKERLLRAAQSGWPHGKRLRPTGQEKTWLPPFPEKETALGSPRQNPKPGSIAGDDSYERLSR